MTYAVDFAIDIMQMISSPAPVMFQRNSSLFIASQQGFAQITYGLNTQSQKKAEWQEEAPEILESQDAIIRRSEEGFRDYKTTFRKGEGKYLLPILFSKDSDAFTLEDMIKAAEALQKLPDDGKIRMVSHDSTYHSHKYGYAADGIDVWVCAARVMNRKRYLELVKKNETDLLGSIGALEGLSHQQISASYSRLKFPDCVIMTPYLLVSFPRGGRLSNLEHNQTDWRQSTSLEHSWNGTSNGSILTYRELRNDVESPFNIYVTLNSLSFKGKTQSSLESKSASLINQFKKELDALYKATEKGQLSIESINNAHNKACTTEIKRFRESFPDLAQRYQSQA